MATKSDKEKKQNCETKTPISQTPDPKPTSQYFLNTILEQIVNAKEEQCLEYTLPKENAYFILQLLKEDAEIERQMP